MNKAIIKKAAAVFSAIAITATAFSGCSANTESGSSTLNIVATTTMLADSTKNIAGDKATVSGLMGPGVDPHLYVATQGDVQTLTNADVVVYNGVHLEGKMGEVFGNLEKIDKNVICIADGISEDKLLVTADSAGAHDPHIWFSVDLWKDAAKAVADGLTESDEANGDYYKANLESYLKELDELDEYIKNRVAELPEESRVLITAHDAFHYFGNSYGFEVKGLQGISTATEAGTADVSALAEFIVEHKIKAVFTESSVSEKSMQALQEAVKAKGFDVKTGGTLYSDSLGDEASGTETYIKTFKANVDTIVDALK